MALQPVKITPRECQPCLLELAALQVKWSALSFLVECPLVKHLLKRIFLRNWENCPIIFNQNPAIGLLSIFPEAYKLLQCKKRIQSLLFVAKFVIVKHRKMKLHLLLNQWYLMCRKLFWLKLTQQRDSTNSTMKGKFIQFWSPFISYINNVFLIDYLLYKCHSE